jgi:DNA-binding XRE family transcriptional regulator
MNTKKLKPYGVKEMEKEFGVLTIARMLVAHRLGEEMSQKDFAKLLGITSASLCDMEKGRKIPSAIRASKIAKKLGMLELSWVEMAIQDQLRKDKIYCKVRLENAS